MNITFWERSKNQGFLQVKLKDETQSAINTNSETE